MWCSNMWLGHWRASSINKPLTQFLKVQFAQDMFHSLLCVLSRRIRAARNDELVLHPVLPADQFRHRYLVAV